jgi:hypothetical protein
MKVVRWISASLAVVGAALLLAPAAFAQSTDLYPGGDTVATSLTSAQGGTTMNCPVNLGAFTLPAKGNPSGSVTGAFTTRPTFECKSPIKVETLGEWSISVQYGTGQATITIPAGGIKEWVGSLQTLSNTMNAWTWNGVWNNGFSSPVSVPSSIDLLPTEDTFYSGGEKRTATLGTAFTTLTDTTHPASLPLLGP